MKTQAIIALVAGLLGITLSACGDDDKGGRRGVASPTALHYIKALLWLSLLGSGMALAGCGGDDTESAPALPPADTLSISIDGGPATTYTEAADSSNPIGFDPLMYGVYDPGSNLTIIELGSGYNTSFGWYDVGAIWVFFGNTTGTKTLFFSGYYNPTLGCYIGSPPSSGGLTVTQYGAIGGRIQGNFNPTLAGEPGTSCPGGGLAGTGSVTVTGTFDVTRQDPSLPLTKGLGVPDASPFSRVWTFPFKENLP